MYKLLFSLLLILSTSSVNAQITTADTLNNEDLAWNMWDISVVDYIVPFLERNKRDLRRKKKYLEKWALSMPNTEDSLAQVALFNEIKNGEWHIEDSLRLDSLLLQPEWNRYLKSQLWFPDEAMFRELEDTVVISFDLVDGGFIQNAKLVKGTATVLVLTLFEELAKMPRMKSRESFTRSYYSDQGYLTKRVVVRTQKFNLKICFELR